MAKAYVSYKDIADFGGVKNANLVEIWRESYLNADGSIESPWYFFISMEDIKGLRSGLYVFVYVRLEKGDRFTSSDLDEISNIIYGRGGIFWDTMKGNVFGLIPRWGKEKITDRGGKTYDLKMAIKLYAQRKPPVEVWKIINQRRAKHGKPPYPFRRFSTEERGKREVGGVIDI